MNHSRQPRLTRSTAVLTAAGVLLAAVGVAPVSAAVPTDLFISEYVEGPTGANAKVLELYNGTAAPIDLAAGAYVIDFYTNGAATPSGTIALIGTVPASDVFTIANPSSIPLLLALARQQDAALNFNGNDALVLRKGAAVLDSIGQVGFDPGAAGWGTDPVDTVDVDLFRKAAVTSGDTNPTDAFDPAAEWSAFGGGIYGIGQHTIDTGGGGGGGGGEPADSGQVAADVTLEAETACIELSTTSISFGTLGFAVEEAPATPNVTITSCSTAEIQVNASATDATGTGATWTLVNDGSTCGGSPDLGTNQYRLGITGPGFADGPIALDKLETSVAGLVPTASTTHTPVIWMPCSGSDGDGQRMEFFINYTAMIEE